MKVQVVVAIDGAKEITLVGEAAVFGPVDYNKGRDILLDIGFWLTSWKLAGKRGHPHNGRCFIPWSSALYIFEMKEGGKDEAV